ncbi:MAG: endopeptidase La [Clostridia bacterium]|nr:endopeptidase La [Clostridia bacterium]
MSTRENRLATLPMLVLRGLVCFPDAVVHFDVGRLKSVAALNAAMENDQRIFLVAQKDVTKDDPKPNELYRMGVVARVRQIVKLPHDNFRIIVEGDYRATAVEILQTEPYFVVVTQERQDRAVSPALLEDALIRECRQQFERYTDLVPKLAPDVMYTVASDDDAGHLADYVASNLNMPLEEKQRILNIQSITSRMETLLRILDKECQILELEKKIEAKVQEQMDENQKEYYLREQIRAISEELGEGDDPLEESGEYTKAINELGLPEAISTQLHKESRKLGKMPPGSHEATVVRTYLDTCLALPWNTATQDNLDLKRARKILDRDHDGLDKVKERIVEALAVRQLSQEMKGQVLCLVGPPGVGKTSIARSIAEAMGRKYVRVSLGGVRDESEIRGHRRTYVGAMPGRIISAIKQAGTKNPLLLLDEIDKMGNDFRGDPASAMLEVLDTEQNNAFRDHYIDLPFDLSEVMFVTTANDASSIPAPLYDRMDVITLSSYTAEEKKRIAKRHLLKKQMKKHGLAAKQLRLTDSALAKIIECYTAEAGVRTLERQLATLCRKTAAALVEGKCDSVSVNTGDLETYLGPEKFKPDHIRRQDEVGVVNGLAWTAVGGATMAIEVAVLEGTGKVELTGNLGDVMKESARTAISYVRSRADDWHIDRDFYKNKDIHIHVPEGAVPKDGPSAGVTMATAIVSALTGIPVRSDVAMTGEISLRGRVMPIGGLREKAMAAYTHRMTTVIIPEDNRSDLSEVDTVVKEHTHFISAKQLDTVIGHALTADPAAAR